MNYTNEVMGRYYMFIAMVISGTIGYFALESQQAAENVVFARCVIGALFLALYVFTFKKYPSFNDISLKISIGLLVGGVTLVSNWLFLFQSYSELSMGLTTVIYNTQPFILIILGSILLKEKLKLEYITLVVISFVGLITIVLGGDIQESDIKITGVVNALIAAILYALSTIYTKKVSNLTPAFIALCHLLIGCIIFANFFDIDNFSFHIDNVHNLIVLGLVHTGLMYIFLYSAYEMSNVSSLAIMSFIYPLVALIVDVIIYDLVLTKVEILGVFIIFFSLMTYNILNHIKQREDYEMFSWFVSKEIEITFNERVFFGTTKKTILQSAIENNIPIRYNCGSGVCGQCAITINSGELKNKIVLACQYYSESNVHISQQV